MTERELFEEKFGRPPHWVDFDEVKNKYECKYNAIDYHLMLYNARWEAWQASANRQGCKLVPVELTNKMALAAKSVDGRLSAFKYGDVYKAMINAI